MGNFIVSQEQIDNHKAGGTDAVEAAIAEQFPQARINVSRLGGNQIFIKFNPDHIVTHAFPLVGKARQYEYVFFGPYSEGMYEDARKPFSFTLDVESRRDDFGEKIV